MYNLYTTVYHSMFKKGFLLIYIGIFLPIGPFRQGCPGSRAEAQAPWQGALRFHDVPRSTAGRAMHRGSWRTPGPGIRLGSWTSWGIPDPPDPDPDPDLIESHGKWMLGLEVSARQLPSKLGCMEGVCRWCWDTSISMTPCFFLGMLIKCNDIHSSTVINRILLWPSFHKIYWGVAQLMSRKPLTVECHEGRQGPRWILMNPKAGDE